MAVPLCACSVFPVYLGTHPAVIARLDRAIKETPTSEYFIARSSRAMTRVASNAIELKEVQRLATDSRCEPM
jgi:hypothetical protein